MKELQGILYKACLTLDTSKISAVLEKGTDINEQDICSVGYGKVRPFFLNLII